jgi:ferrous iron transport protein B
LATVATPVAYVIAPVVGVVMWQLAASAITGFIAKECVVGTLATCFAFEHLIGDELEIIGGSSTIASSIGITSAAALAFLMFNLFTPPCFAAIGAMNSEIKSKKWLFAGVGLQFAVGYTVAFLAFFFVTLFSGESFGEIWMPVVGWSILLVIGAIITAVIIKNDAKHKKEAALKAQKKKEAVNV